MTFTYAGSKNEEGKLKLYIGSCENSPPDIVKLKRLLDFNPEISEVNFREFEEGDLMNTIKVILGYSNIHKLEMPWSSSKVARIKDEASIFAKLLENNNTITKIDYPSAHIRADGAKAFAEMLSLREVKMDYLGLHFNQIGAQGALELASQMDKIVDFDLSWNNIFPEGIRFIADNLKNNILTKKLNLGSNGMGPIAAGYLGKALKSNSMLIDLNLESAFMNNEGFSLLVAGIEQNSTLKVLNLRRNKISDVSEHEITVLMSKLSVLNLDVNNIGDVGVKFIANELPNNQNLVYLRLEDNNITQEGGVHIRDALQTNMILTSLGLGGMRFTPFHGEGVVANSILPDDLRVINAKIQGNFNFLKASIKHMKYGKLTISKLNTVQAHLFDFVCRVTELYDPQIKEKLVNYSVAHGREVLQVTGHLVEDPYVEDEDSNAESMLGLLFEHQDNI